MRHGEAASAESDARRPLSPVGRRQVEDLAKQASERGVAPARILHSGKLRAKQTAEILRDALGNTLGGGIECGETAGLDPEDDPQSMARLAAESHQDLMLVGHLPFMGILASRLLRESRELAFPTATMACLERTKDWKLLWKISGGR